MLRIVFTREGHHPRFIAIPAYDASKNLAVPFPAYNERKNFFNQRYNGATDDK
jgi:hypothetical protein